jgi:hypothetical protein
MSLILSGTDGLSDVDGSAATPAIRGTDANTGIFFGADTIGFSEGGVEAARINSSGQFDLVNNPVLTGGTANGVAYLNGSKVLTTGSALVFDGTNLGVGVTPSAWASFKSMDVNDGGAGLTSSGQNCYLTTNAYYNSGWKYKFTTVYGVSWYEQFNGQHAWFSAPSGTAGNAISATQAMTLDASGNLLVGTTGLGTIGSTSGFQITSSGAIYSASTGDSVFSRRSANGTVITFRRDTTSVGSIDVTTTATSYVTSSDYRLKNTIAPMTGALAKVAALKPVTYKWNVDGSDGEGFIAHELAEVVPQCVTGEKDAVDEEGNPKYQGIDTSFLVATLTAAIQEQQALITQLTARITALESA